MMLPIPKTRLLGNSLPLAMVIAVRKTNSMRFTKGEPQLTFVKLQMSLDRHVNYIN